MISSRLPNTPLCLLGATLLATAAPVGAQRSLKEIPDPDPAVQAATFKAPEGMEINLFAGDPEISKPVQMNWDAKGRLWVVCSPLYPHIKPGQKAEDRVVVLEDADGDGTAEKSTVFATGLEIPTAIIPVDGGCYVANSTELLFLEDRDGDLVSDSRQIILSGFGTEDTHHLLHTFRRGPGGLIHFNQSIYIHSHIETPYGVKRLMGGGIWHFRPADRHLGILSKGLVNPWGFEFDRWGQSFATDGAGGNGINFIFPGSVFVTSPGAPRILRGLNPGQPKHCGLEIASGPNLPPDWDGHLLTCDFRGNRLNRFSLADSGSTYLSTQEQDPLTSTHGAFRPIDLRVGPDGALYIADWYNPIIQHGEVDFRDPRRDHTHGRIWRLRLKEGTAPARPDYATAGVPELIELLRSPFRPHRQFAREALARRESEEVMGALGAWVGSDEDRLEALWVSMALRQPDPTLMEGLLSASDYRFRAAALRVLYFTADLYPETEVLGYLTTAIADAEPRVRLWAVSSLAARGGGKDLSLALRAVDQPVDEPIDFALEKFARETAPTWLPAFQGGELTLGDKPEHAVFALRAAGGAPAAASLLDMLREGTLQDPTAPASAVARAGNPEQLGQLFQLAEGTAQKPILHAILEGAKTRPVRPAGDLGKLGALLASDDAETATIAAQLTGYWKAGELRPALAAGMAKDGLRIVCAEALGRLGGEESAAALGEAAASADPALRAAAVRGRTFMGAEAGANLAAVVLTRTEIPEEAPAIIAPLLTKKGGIPALAKALEGKTIPTPVAVAALTSAGSAGVDITPLSAALKKAGSIRQMGAALSPEETATLTTKVGTEGDPHRGERIYRRAPLACISCHAIGETGGLIGPNLVSMGSSAPVDYLIESLLDPNAKIKEGYHTTLINTEDGGVFAGGLVSEGDGTTIIRDAAGQHVEIASDKITKKEVSPVSLMPPGLTASLREDEFVDLVRFLSELGKEGPFKTPAGRFVRSFARIPALDKAQADKLGHWGGAALAKKDPELPWQPVLAYVDGRLPLEEIPIPKARRLGRGFLQFALEVSSEGTVHLGFGNAAGIAAFAEGGELTIEEGTAALDLAVGTHYVGLMVDPTARNGAPIKIELLPVTKGGAAARVLSSP